MTVKAILCLPVVAFAVASEVTVTVVVSCCELTIVVVSNI